MKDIDLVKLKVLAARLLNPTDRFSEVSDKFEWKAVASPAVISALIEQLEAAQRERDDAVSLRLQVSGELSSATIRYEKAEAELKRRDAVVPVGVIRENPDDIGLIADFDVMPPVGTKLYTAAPAAVNSPEIPGGWLLIPAKASQQHLNSIAMRYRHDFYLLPDNQKDSALATARQMYEECSGQGFYSIPKPE